jgi:hypothetical protein
MIPQSAFLEPNPTTLHLSRVLVRRPPVRFMGQSEPLIANDTASESSFGEAQSRLGGLHHRYDLAA